MKAGAIRSRPSLFLKTKTSITRRSTGTRSLFAPIHPIAIQPLFQNDRILAQKGMFTVHGDNTDPIETLCPKAVKKIVIAPQAVAGAEEFLEIANIDARSVYPDMAGIADYVRRVAGI